MSLLGQIRGESADPGGRAVVRPLHRAEPYMRTCVVLFPLVVRAAMRRGVSRARFVPACVRISTRPCQSPLLRILHSESTSPSTSNFNFNFNFIRTVSTHTRARTAPLLTCVCVSVCCVSVFASLCLCTPTPRFSAPRFSAPRLPAPRLSPPRRLSPWAALGCTRLRSCAAPARPLGCTESPPPGLHSRAVTVFPAPW